MTFFVGVQHITVEIGVMLLLIYPQGQTLLKSPVVLVSHEEVERYLGIRAQTAAEESMASRGDHVSAGGVCSVCCRVNQ